MPCQLCLIFLADDKQGDPFAASYMCGNWDLLQAEGYPPFLNAMDFFLRTICTNYKNIRIGLSHEN